MTDKPSYEELVEALEDCLYQGCWQEDTEWVDDDTKPGGKRIVRSNGRLDSSALSAYADGLILLERLGKVRVRERYGRRVIATPVDKDT